MNVNQADSVPFVASSAGVIIGIEAESQAFHPENGIFIPTGFEANIALTHVSKGTGPNRTKDTISRIFKSLTDIIRFYIINRIYVFNRFGIYSI